MKDFVYEKENALETNICNDIINFFNSNINLQRQGVVGKGNDRKIDTKLKNTTDICIDNTSIKETDKLYSTIKFIQEEIEKNVNEYLKNLTKYNIVIEKSMVYKQMIIHKYKKGEGIFNYHHDFSVEPNYFKYRLINFLIYLNDIDIGGETDFFEECRIKPQAGKLVFFPSEWFFFHKGNVPISEDKYVIAGWILYE
jgi:hypothetical protein